MLPAVPTRRSLRMACRSSDLFFLACISFVTAIPSSSGSLRINSAFNIGNGDSFGIPGNATFDYVVVGGGTAGNAIAARLAEDPSISVAVVEAGGFYQIESGNRSVVPGYAFGNQAAGTEPDPLTDWGYITEPIEGLAGRSIPYARGKTLGGSSALNYMAYHRPTVGSFELWATAVEDNSYLWENVLPYYQRSATFTPPNNHSRLQNTTLIYEPEAFDNSLNGPLQVSFPNYAPSFATWAQLGLVDIGVPINDGMSYGSLFGTQWSEATISPSNAHRSSSQTSYLRQGTDTTTLTVYTHTFAERILFSSDRAAIGVEVSTGSFGNQQNFTLSVNKEVILSAGAFQSPQLLMLSGIGPNKTLTDLDIPIISALEGVGNNMWDHILISSAYALNLTTDSQLMNTTSPYTLQAVANYTRNATGPLTDAAPMLGWENVPSSLRSNISNATLSNLSQTFPADWPEIEFLVETAYSGSKMMAPDDHLNYATIATALITPFSRGSVSINSTSAHDLPVVNPNYLSHPSDMELLLAAFKRQRDFWSSSSMSSIIIGEEFEPGADTNTDAEIEQYIRKNVLQLYHASCTCKMGPPEDKMAVVDSKARVFGVHGLRVVDASAFPFLPPGHPQSTIYMLAEKIAADIKAGI